MNESGLMSLQKRCVLHDRVKQLASLRHAQLDSHLQWFRWHDGKAFYVTVDELWLENFMDAFSICEDWGILFKTSI